MLLPVLQSKVRTALGDWDGLVNVLFDSCDVPQQLKRQYYSLVTCTVYLNGIAADSAMEAVERYFASNSTVDLGQGVTATYVSSTPPPSYPEIYAYGEPGLSGGAIAGIVIGAVAGAILVFVVLVAAIKFLAPEPKMDRE